MTEGAREDGRRTVDDSVAEEPGPRPRASELPIGPRDRYAIAGEHARGGFGVVLRARDQRLARTVAIKELAADADSRAGERFVREALITARLQHPGIVPVYEAGRWPDGQPYYAMKLVSGRTLREELAARATLAERLALLPSVLAVAEAVGYAHSEGVIHRDLKPDNVLVGAFGETVVLDWGLAKDLGTPDGAVDIAGSPAASPDATRAGAVLGTPAYMAPEQARGEGVDQRADVWAIGAILYHVLAAAPPFEGAPDSVVERVASQPPPPLATRAPNVPRDLLAIVDKAMARDPAARYADAKALADDLGRFLTGQLVRARHYGYAARLERWVRRHRAPVAVAAVLLAVLAVFATLSIRRILDERRIARARTNELLVTQARSQLDRDPTAVLAWLKLYPDDGVDWEAVRAIAADASSRGAARHVWRGHPEYVNAIAVSPDGRVVASASGDVLQLWAPMTGHRIAQVKHAPVFVLAISPDGALLASGGQDGAVTVRALGPAGEPGPPRVLGNAGPLVDALVFTPDGRSIVTGDFGGGVRLWPVDGAPGRELTHHAGAIAALEVVEHGAAVVSIGAGDLELRRAPLDGAPAQSLLAVQPSSGSGLAGAIRALAIAGDGRALVIAIDDRVVRWEVGGAPVELVRHRGAVSAIAVSASGRVVSGGDDGSVMSAGGGPPRALVGHSHAITRIAFGADDELVATGDNGGDVRVWSKGGSELLRGHDGTIGALSFHGDTLISAGDDGSVRVWAAPHASRVIDVGTGSVFRLAFLSAATIATTGEDGAIHAIATATGASREIGRHTKQAYDLEPLPGGKLATSSWDGSILVFGPDGAPLRRLDHGAQVWAIAASRDGRWLASAGADGAVRLWDLASGEERELERRTGEADDVAFSPDGRTLAASGADTEIHVFDLVAGGGPRRLVGHVGDPLSLTWSKTGQELYSAGGDGVVLAWDLATGKRRALTGHQGQVRTIALSPDQRYLASGGADGLVIVWDLAGGDRAIVLRGHTAEVRRVAFSRDSRQLASAGWDGIVRLWNVTDGRVMVWRGHDGKVQHVEISPDGTLVASAGADGKVRLWSVDDHALIPSHRDALRSWLDAMTTAQIDDTTTAIRPQTVTTPPGGSR